MATISTPQFLDSTTSRTAGEAWTINIGGELTIRTDTRYHAYSPASMTGSLGSLTINEGNIIIDARNVRWLAYNSGTGNVPTIGTSITQAGVTSSYLLGVYASLTSAPTTAGSAMPASGFIKFREVTGAFIAGALTGIGASATGADVTGWIEVVCDQAANITVPRLGKFQTRGDRFYLNNTNGSLGQTFQLPTNGGGAGTTTIGAWVETGVGTGEYEFWPALTGASNGWAYQHIGMPPGQSDVRQQFFKDNGSGVMQLGETVTLTGATYAATAAAASTYAETYQTLYYVWENNEVIFYGTHYYEVGDSVGIDFPAGGPADGIYTVTDVLGFQCFKIAATGSGAGNSATCRSRLSIVVPSSTANVGDTIYCDFTTGTGVDGTFVLKDYNTTNTFSIHYPRTAALTVGNVSVHYGITVTTSAAHNLYPGHRVKINFTSGTGVSGVYTVIICPSTTTFVINVPFNGGTGGNCTIDFQLGLVPEAGRKVWVPNIFLRQCVTGTRASNATPHATIASRPEFTTTSAGKLDMQYTYGDWYFNILQPYSVDLRYNATSDAFYLSECATAPYIEHLGIGMYGALDVVTFNVSYLLSGFYFRDIVAMRGNTPGSSDNSITIANSFNGDSARIRSGIIQYVRSSGEFSIASCIDSIFDQITAINVPINVGYGPRTTLTNVNYCDRMTGWQGGGVSNLVPVSFNYNPPDCKLDGLNFGFDNTIPNQMPNINVVGAGAAPNLIVRNIGTRLNPISGRSSFRPYAWGVSNLIAASLKGGCKYQRLYADRLGSTPISDANSGLGGVFESIFTDQWNPGRAALYDGNEQKGGVYRGIAGGYAVGANTAVYGVHFSDTFQRKLGEYVLLFNEPITETLPYFTVLGGNPRFNSSGGIVMFDVGDSAEWEDPYFRKGHTGLFGGIAQSICEISGGTQTYYYLIQYQIDKGNGFNGTWLNASRPKQVTGTIGQYTCTVSDASDLSVGDYVQHYQYVSVQRVAFGAKITEINGNTLTLNKPNFASSASEWHLFSQFPSETGIDPSVGFRLKIRITTVTAGASAAITKVRVLTTCSDESKALCLYPLDVNTVTFTGLPSGCDMVVLTAGTSTILYQVDSYSGTSITYTYEGAQTVDVGFVKPGYIPFYIRNLSLSTTNTSIPVSLTADRNYL